MNAASEYLQLSRESADELVRRHAPLVRRIAYHLMGRLPASVDVGDLIQAGMIGLLEAARHFAHDKGASFETFAGIRIRGAMLDELRRADWTPRSVHRKTREVAETIRQIEAETGAVADDAEVVLDARLEGQLLDGRDAHVGRGLGHRDGGRLVGHRLRPPRRPASRRPPS